MALNYTNIIKQAKARERKIVRLRKLRWSFQEIGDEFMISRQRAQQIYKKALICNAELWGAPPTGGASHTNAGLAGTEDNK